METLELQDIHLPGSAAFWPLALGWWILLFLVIIGGSWLIFKLLQRTKKRKYRANILAKFLVLEKKLKAKPSNAIIAEINTLLRQLAITYYSRQRIASLTGANWLKFLDESGGTQDFSRGAGRILIEAPYQKESRLDQQIENFNINEFLPLVRSWTQKIVKANS